MAGEINRVLQLTANAVIPVTYQVPRKVRLLLHRVTFIVRIVCPISVLDFWWQLNYDFKFFSKYNVLLLMNTFSMNMEMLEKDSSVHSHSSIA